MHVHIGYEKLDFPWQFLFSGLCHIYGINFSFNKAFWKSLTSYVGKKEYLLDWKSSVVDFNYLIIRTVFHDKVNMLFFWIFFLGQKIYPCPFQQPKAPPSAAPSPPRTSFIYSKLFWKTSIIINLLNNNI